MILSFEVLLNQMGNISLRRGGPAGMCLFEVSKEISRTMREIYSKLTLNVILVALFLTLNRFHTLFWGSTVGFKQGMELPVGRNPILYVKTESVSPKIIFF